MSARLRTASRLLLLCLFAWLLGACSFDPHSNKLYKEKCPEGQRRYKGFCITDLREVEDMDGGADADSGPAQSTCEHEGEQELCYDGEIETSRQLPCRVGFRVCRDGVWSKCEGQVLPAAVDICNNIDDDCDSKIDEGASGASCVTGLHGICEEGIEICSNGKTRCRSLYDQGVEMCPADGELAQDLDCDGLVGNDDPDLTKPCYDAADDGCTMGADGKFTCRGECQPGTQVCGGACENAVTARAEEPTLPLDGGVPEPRDEDCDGQYDEGLGCTPGEYPCYTGPANTRDNGICQPGTRVCVDPDAGLSECMGEIKPQPETCADIGIDNDCDGDDQDVDQLGDRCFSSGAMGECGATAVLQCNPATQTLACTPGAPSDEICGDGKDNDCDGHTDDRCGSAGTCCGQACVNLQDSNLHCGGCNNACPAGWGCCGGVCKNLNNDLEHCGYCRNNCALLGPISLTSRCENRVCRGLGL